MNLKTLGQKLANLFSRGKLLELKTDTKIPTAKVGLMADEVFDGIEYPQDFGIKSIPPKDSEIITAHFGGNRSHGTILKAFKRDILPEDLVEGETCIYNGFNTEIRLDKDSNIKINNGGVSIAINNDGSVTIITAGTVTLDTPIVAMTGDLLVTGSINGVTIP